MKFVSFNINGLRARPHQLEAIVEKHQPDVIGLQETKVHDDMFPLEEVAKLGYNVFYHGQKGHYGVALLTKETPIAVRRGFPGDDEEAQRRIIMAEIPSPLGNVTVINGYFPQGESRDHPIKFPAKAQFYQNLQNYLETELKRENPVLIMGDMNISPGDLDIGIGEENRKRWLRTGKCSFLPEEREWMERLMSWGLVDTFRHANPQTADRFSWFDYRSKGFDDNDHFSIIKFDIGNSTMNAERKFLLACLIFALVIYAIHAFGLFDLLTDLPHLQTLIRQSGLFGYSLYILLFIIATLFLLPGSILVIAGGIVFGPLLGTLLSLIAATLASSCSFLLARWLGRDLLLKYVGHSHTFQAIEKGIARNGIDFLILTRLIPLFPYNIQNYAYGLTTIAFWPYTLISALTTLPGIVIYTVMASDLANEGITLRFILQLCLAGLALFILVQLAKLYARHKHVDLSASRRSPLSHPKNEG